MIRTPGAEMAEFWASAWGMGSLLIILLSCQVTIWTSRINDSVSERIFCWVMSIICVLGWLHRLEETTPHLQTKAMVISVASWLAWRCIRKIITPKRTDNATGKR